MVVTVADCVPVFLLDPGKRAVAVLHAGWRGAASGILERGVEAMADTFESRPKDLFLHLGPSICGACYEVGPEVHRALGLPETPRPSPIDLRGHLAALALAGGVDGSRVTVSGWCTRCDGSPFFSHRRGDRKRQVAFMGIDRWDEEEPAQGHPGQ